MIQKLLNPEQQALLKEYMQKIMKPTWSGKIV